MSMINYASREINCKLVYYGPGLGGKTTNLEFVYNKVAPGARGKMISLATETERTLFFDFLPVDLGNDPRLQGQVPPVHGAGTGLLQRLAQAHPQGRGRGRVRRRQPDRADGRQHRGDAEPVREHEPARVRSHQDPVRHPVQQAGPSQRGPGERAPVRAESGLAGGGAGQAAADPGSVSRVRVSGRASWTGSGSSGRRTSRPSRSRATACSIP